MYKNKTDFAILKQQDKGRGFNVVPITCQVYKKLWLQTRKPRSLDQWNLKLLRKEKIISFPCGMTKLILNILQRFRQL